MKKQFAKYLITLIYSSSYFLLQPQHAVAQEMEEVIIEGEIIEDETLNDLVSVSAIDGDKLADAGIENVEDVAAYVPNLVLTQTETGTNTVSYTHLTLPTNDQG